MEPRRGSIRPRSDLEPPKRNGRPQGTAVRHFGSGEGPAHFIFDSLKTTCLRATGSYFRIRSEEHTSELQSLMRISYAVFCLKKKNNTCTHNTNNKNTISTRHEKQQIET